MPTATRRGKKYFTIKNKLLLHSLQRVSLLYADELFALRPVFSLRPCNKDLPNPDEQVLKIDDELLEKSWNKDLIYTALDRLLNERGEDVSKKNKHLMDLLEIYLLSPYTAINYTDVMVSVLRAILLVTGAVLPVTAFILILVVPLMLFQIILGPVLGIVAIATVCYEIAHTFCFVNRDERARHQQAADNLSKELGPYSSAQGEQTLPMAAVSLHQHSTKASPQQSVRCSSADRRRTSSSARMGACESVGTVQPPSEPHNVAKGRSQGFFVGGGDTRRGGTTIPMTACEERTNAVLENYDTTTSSFTQSTRS